MGETTRDDVREGLVVGLSVRSLQFGLLHMALKCAYLFYSVWLMRSGLIRFCGVMYESRF
jgi:hypothetical protein